MLRFRYTCLRHQEAFVAAAHRAGCRELEKMDEIRRKTLAWLSARFPRLVLEHFNEESCIACKLEANGFDTHEVERVVSDFAREMAPETAKDHC
ncbi:MAG TPA: hypothetical protein VN668_16470 [Stellaceae bacterium]|nr:hypothetical protein [Stellaceae bacterium]